MKSKTDIIQEAIDKKAYLAFDYVSTSRKVSLGRLVEPIELKLTEKTGTKLWAHDMKADGLLKQFDLEGIQDPRLIEKGGEDA